MIFDGFHMPCKYARFRRSTSDVLIYYVKHVTCVVYCLRNNWWSTLTAETTLIIMSVVPGNDVRWDSYAMQICTLPTFNGIHTPCKYARFRRSTSDALIYSAEHVTCVACRLRSSWWSALAAGTRPSSPRPPRRGMMFDGIRTPHKHARFQRPTTPFTASARAFQTHYPTAGLNMEGSIAEIICAYTCRFSVHREASTLTLGSITMLRRSMMFIVGVSRSGMSGLNLTCILCQCGGTSRRDMSEKKENDVTCPSANQNVKILHLFTSGSRLGRTVWVARSTITNYKTTRCDMTIW